MGADHGVPSRCGASSSRLDDLPTADRDLVQRLAIVGDTITVRDAALLAERDPADIAAVLAARDLPYPDRVREAILPPALGGRGLRAVARSGTPGFHAAMRAEGGGRAKRASWWEALGLPTPSGSGRGAKSCWPPGSSTGRSPGGGPASTDRFAHERAVEITRAQRFTVDPRKLRRWSARDGRRLGKRGRGRRPGSLPVHAHGNREAATICSSRCIRRSWNSCLP
jgi:hypothetical protein